MAEPNMPDMAMLVLEWTGVVLSKASSQDATHDGSLVISTAGTDKIFDMSHAFDSFHETNLALRQNCSTMTIGHKVTYNAASVANMVTGRNYEVRLQAAKYGWLLLSANITIGLTA